MDRPTLRQLEALENIATQGSFRAAARALGVSQVAISDHIKQLEARLGVALFIRARGGKARISPAGEAALSRARLILSDCDALVAGMREFAEGRGAAVDEGVASVQTLAVVVAPDEAESEDVPPPRLDVPPPEQIANSPTELRSTEEDRPIMIGTHPSILSQFQEKLAAFEDAFPARPVSIDFDCFVADRVAIALSDGTIDMAYFYALGDTRVFPSEYLWSERWSLYVASDHALIDKEYIGRDAVKRLPLLTFSATNRLRPLVESCLSAAGLGEMLIALETDDFGQLAQRTRAGEGVLPLFGAAAARVGAMPGLRRLPYVDPIPAIEVRRVLHPRVAHDDEVQALIATLQ